MRAHESLHEALLAGDLNTALKLIENRTGVNDIDEEGETPLFLAAEYEGLVEALLSAGADVNVRNRLGDTPLHEIARYGTPVQVEALLRYHADIEAENDAGQTPLHVATANGSWQIVKLLVRAGANINRRDVSGKTPLHYAVYGNIMPHEVDDHLLTAKILVDAGADLQALTNSGETPLALAREHYGYPQISAFLESCGAQE